MGCCRLSPRLGKHIATTSGLCGDIVAGYFRLPIQSVNHVFRMMHYLETTRRNERWWRSIRPLARSDNENQPQRSGGAIDYVTRRRGI